MKTIFFPDNKLNAELCDIYNNHTAIVTQDTDSLHQNAYEFVEINAFKHNLQITAFVDSDQIPVSKMLELKNSGRVSFGVYYKTDRWMNDQGELVTIPNYYSDKWSSYGASAFANATEGETKPIRYPNHGQELYDVSNGKYGYDFSTQTAGANNLDENNANAQEQLDYLSPLGKLTSLSYRNGKTEGALLLLPYFLGGRNSSYDYVEHSNIDYRNVTRDEAISRASNTRTWDAVNAGQFATQAASLEFTKEQITRAITYHGWWNDFMHWHYMYRDNDISWFNKFYGAIRSEIGINDVWSAGYMEAVEYMFIRDTVDMVGSFERDGNAYVYYRLNDPYKGTETAGISNDLDVTMLNTPVSIKVDFTGTQLQGKDIKCKEANSIRKLANDVWIINVPYQRTSFCFSKFKIEEGTVDYYSDNIPVLTNVGGKITSDVTCKFVVWSKLSSEGLEKVREVERVNEFSTSYDLNRNSGSNYYIGAISKWGKSSLIEL